MPSAKRKRATASTVATAKPKVLGNNIKDEWHELPHNMGKIRADSQVQYGMASSDDGLTPPAKKTRMTRSMTAKPKDLDDVKLGFKVTKSSSTSPSKAKKNFDSLSIQDNSRRLLTEPATRSLEKKSSSGRTKKTKPKVPTVQSPQMELDKTADTNPVAAEFKEENLPKTRRNGPKVTKAITSPDVVVKADELVESVAEIPKKKKPKKTKDNPYGLTPGYSPFPDWPAPTKHQCQEVTSLLASVHQLPSQPPQPPIPSTTVAGCGEVPSVLDAMIRTLLSAATSGRNSSSAFQGRKSTSSRTSPNPSRSLS